MDNSKKLELRKVKIKNISPYHSLNNSMGEFKMLTATLLYNNKLTEHFVIVNEGGINPKLPVTARINSACFTGDILGCKRCDCNWQLCEALKIIHSTPNSVLIYNINEDGRGQGCTNKSKSIVMMDTLGLRTKDAFEALKLNPDTRNYVTSIFLLKKMKIKVINLISNNPKKYEKLEEFGFVVNKNITLVSPDENLIPYLMSKKEQFNHNICLSIS